MTALLVISFLIGGNWREFSLPVQSLTECHAILKARHDSGAINDREVYFCRGAK